MRTLQQLTVSTDRKIKTANKELNLLKSSATINRSSLMRRAWYIFNNRQYVDSVNGYTYAETFAEALTIAWFEKNQVRKPAIKKINTINDMLLNLYTPVKYKDSMEYAIFKN